MKPAPPADMPLRLLLLAALLAATVPPVFGQEPVRSFTREYSFHPTGVLSISNYKGTIAVAPWDLDEVQVHVTIEAEDVDGEVMLPHVEVRMAGSMDALAVETDYRLALKTVKELFPDTDSPRLPLVHLTIRLPRTARLRIEDYMSAIHLDGLVSDVELYTYKGEVRVDRFGGTLRLNTHRGTAHVDFVRIAHDSVVGSYEGEATVSLPGAAAFLLAVDLGDPAGSFAADSSFATLRRSAAYRTASALRAADTGRTVFERAVNGDGPRLALTTHTGRLRLIAHRE